MLASVRSLGNFFHILRCWAVLGHAYCCTIRSLFSGGLLTAWLGQHWRFTYVTRGMNETLKTSIISWCVRFGSCNVHTWVSGFSSSWGGGDRRDSCWLCVVVCHVCCSVSCVLPCVMCVAMGGTANTFIYFRKCFCAKQVAYCKCAYCQRLNQA